VRRADRAGAILLLLFGAWFAGVALRNYTYWSATGPGSGFFPFWLGLAMAVLAALLLVRAVRDPDPGPAWVPRGRGAVRFLGVLGGAIAFAVLMPWLGMALGTVLFLIGILRLLEGHSWPASLTIAVATAVVNWLVFARWLSVPVPTGVLGF
jgi:putative tricarboxylic transport membrane protein